MTWSGHAILQAVSLISVASGCAQSLHSRQRSGTTNGADGWQRATNLHGHNCRLPGLRSRLAAYHCVGHCLLPKQSRWRGYCCNGDEEIPRAPRGEGSGVCQSPRHGGWVVKHRGGSSGGRRHVTVISRKRNAAPCWRACGRWRTGSGGHAGRHRRRWTTWSPGSARLDAGLHDEPGVPDRSSRCGMLCCSVCVISDIKTTIWFLQIFLTMNMKY